MEAHAPLSQAAAGARTTVGEHSNLGSWKTYSVLPVVVGTCPSLTLSSPCGNPVRRVPLFPFFRWGKRGTEEMSDMVASGNDQTRSLTTILLHVSSPNGGGCLWSSGSWVN